MRQIKFRAWDKDDSRMYEVAKLDFWGDPDQASCDLAGLDEDGELVELFDIYLGEVEIMQYTGLKDKNGVEVYEGDILRNVDNPAVDKLPFEVKWNEYYGAWFWWSLLGEAGTDHLYQNIAKNCEIIGNIHDWREE